MTGTLTSTRCLFWQEKKADLVVRASVDRVLMEKEVRKLWAKVQQQPMAGHLTLQITQNQQRPARQATVSVRLTPVKLRTHWRPNQKKLPVITLNAILAREDDPPQGVDEPIECLLETNTSVQNFDEAVRVVEAGCGVRTPSAGTECGVSSGALEFGDVAGEPTSALAIAAARSPTVEAYAQQLIAPEAVEAIPKIEFDQTANLTAEAGDNQWTSPVDVDAEPVPELEFDQTFGW